MYRVSVPPMCCLESKPWTALRELEPEVQIEATILIVEIQSLGRKWRKMSKAAKSKFSNPEQSVESSEKVPLEEKPPEKASFQDSAPPSDKAMKTVTNEDAKIINQLNELANQRQAIANEKEKITKQIKKIGIEKKKIAYERAQLQKATEELINQLREFTKILEQNTVASEDKPESNDPGSKSKLKKVAAVNTIEHISKKSKLRKSKLSKSKLSKSKNREVVLESNDPGSQSKLVKVAEVKTIENISKNSKLSKAKNREDVLEANDPGSKSKLVQIKPNIANVHAWSAEEFVEEFDDDEDVDEAEVLGDGKDFGDDEELNDGKDSDDSE